MSPLKLKAVRPRSLSRRFRGQHRHGRKLTSVKLHVRFRQGRKKHYIFSPTLCSRAKAIRIRRLLENPERLREVAQRSWAVQSREDSEAMLKSGWERLEKSLQEQGLFPRT